MIPQYFIELDALPQTPNGKIDRNALPAPDLDALALTDGYRAPRSDAEKLLAAIWEELLGVESVGIHDNFVEMGGHSLLALQAISRIKEELGVNVSAMAMIMDTLEQIAAQFSDEGPIAESGNSNVPQANTAEPFYFGPDDTLFGLHHKPPHDLGNDTCILLCGPVYVESITAHWALKRLADQLARVGFHVLRFDYFGNGDSMGESEEGNVDRWLTDITSAAEKIMDLSGCEQVSLVGLRFGATLATLSGLENLKDVVLWDPIVSGEDYMTYMRSQHRSMIAACDARRVDPVTEGPNELLGFFCSPAAQDTIEASTIAASGEAKVQRVTMITHEKSAELDQLETSIAANCLSLVRHEIDDARCEISAKGRLTAFLPGASLRIITSLFSEQSS